MAMRFGIVLRKATIDLYFLWVVSYIADYEVLFRCLKAGLLLG